MNSENAQVNTVFLHCSRGEHSVKCVRPALEMEARKEEQKVQFVSWWLLVLRHTICQNALECGRTESSFCMIMPIPILPIWWGICFRDLAGKHFNILHTAQIFPLMSSTYLATWRKTFMDISFFRTRKSKSGWGGSISDLPLSTRLELIVSSPSGINVLTLLAITFE